MGEHFGAHLHASFLEGLLVVEVFLEGFELVGFEDVLRVADVALVELVHFLNETIDAFFVEDGGEVASYFGFVGKVSGELEVLTRLGHGVDELLFLIGRKRGGAT